ncbi:hypothetical protein KIN20_013063 [Parelaphostrongylus tenuis]|uniref:Uncharacterized protein n=1 Tax=Parelaphostrongylus tenuis TaxID=148309 RepID=A0AAD5QN83_PARTN|nr:hypothetical protein KIN20_013063 [Parelaphostrongylus tenuis]
MHKPRHAQQSLATTTSEPHPLDNGKDDVLGQLRHPDIRPVRSVPSTALFPQDVTLCDGFGFACINKPVRILCIK